MSIKSKIRKWIFPAKEDNFDDSYDYLLEFFNVLDEEYGGLVDFLFDYRIKKFFRTETEISNYGGEDGDYGLYIKTGDILQFSSLNGWEIKDRIGRLPKIKQRDPNISDIGVYDEGETWINVKSGKAYKFIGSMLVDDVSGLYEAMWVNQEGRVEYQTSSIKQFIFYPKMDFNFKTKTLSMVGGLPTFEDDLMHLEGVIASDGIVQFLDHDTHVDITLKGVFIGTLIINRKNIQTLMDIQYFNPVGGLPAHGTPEIYEWFQRFERMLLVMEISANTNNQLDKVFKNGMIFNFPITEIIEDATVFNAFFDQNGYLLFPGEQVSDIKEKYRSYFSATHFQEMSIVEKQWAMYLLGSCVAWEAYDGNIYYINGNTMLADGNVEPTC